MSCRDFQCNRSYHSGFKFSNSIIFPSVHDHAMHTALPFELPKHAAYTHVFDLKSVTTAEIDEMCFDCDNS